VSMSSPLRSVLNSVTRLPDDRLNVITFSTSPLLDNIFTNLPLDFYYWTSNYPHKLNFTKPNCYILGNEVPLHVDYDAVIIFDQGHQYAVGRQIADFLHIPLILFERNIPSLQGVKHSKMLKINARFYSSESVRKLWQGAGCIINLGVEYPKILTEKQPLLISPDAPTEIHQHIQSNLMNTQLVVGYDMPIEIYEKASYFLSTTGLITAELLTAMSQGCIPILFDVNDAKKVIKHGENGYIINNLNMLQQITALNNDLGKKVIESVVANYPLEKFTKKANTMIKQVVDTIYTR
jgi:hypothetical protein